MFFYSLKMSTKASVNAAFRAAEKSLQRANKAAIASIKKNDSMEGGRKSKGGKGKSKRRSKK